MDGKEIWDGIAPSFQFPWAACRWLGGPTLLGGGGGDTMAVLGGTGARGKNIPSFFFF